MNGGMTSCIGLTCTCRSAGPGCASQSLTAVSSWSALETVWPQRPSARNPREIRVLQFRESIEHALGLLLDLHKAELAVVIDGNLDGQLLLDDRHQVPEQHRNPAVARHAHDLPAGFRLLEPNGRRHAVGHRSMKQTRDNATPAVRLDMAIGPGGRGAVV